MHFQGNNVLPVLLHPHFPPWETQVCFLPPPILMLEPLTSKLILTDGLVVCILHTSPSDALMRGFVIVELFWFLCFVLP